MAFSSRQSVVLQGQINNQRMTCGRWSCVIYWTMPNFSLSRKFKVSSNSDYCIVSKCCGGAFYWCLFCFSVLLQGSGWTQRAVTWWQQGQHHHLHPNPRQAFGWIWQPATSWAGRWVERSVQLISSWRVYEWSMLVVISVTDVILSTPPRPKDNIPT